MADDGRGKPEGYITPDHHLVVIDGEYHETAEGTMDRWRRQAPDLLEMYFRALDEIEKLRGEHGHGK